MAGRKAETMKATTTACIVSDGSRGAALYIGQDFAEAALLQAGKREPVSHGRIRVGQDGPTQDWHATVSVVAAEAALFRAAGTLRVKYLESQAC